MTISKQTLHEIMACSPVIFNQFLVGLGFGWTAPMLTKLQNSNDTIAPLTQNQVSWLASIHDIGKVSGPIISPFIVDNIGRRYSIILITILLFFVWSSQIFLSNIKLLCSVRLIFGVTVGISDVAMSIYITENCSPGIRAVMGGILSVIYSMGSFTELLLATFLTFRGTAIANTILSMCAFSALYFCIETPSFLIMKERYFEAERNLTWLRGGRSRRDDSNELEKLRNNVLKEKAKQKSWIKLLSSSANIRSLFIVLSLYVISTMTGGSGISPYSVMIFQPSKMFTSYQYTILYSMLHFVAVCLSPFVISKTSRRNLLVACYSLVGLCHTGTFLVFYLDNRGYKTDYFPWLVFVPISLYGAISAMSGPAMFVIRSEILPLSVRAIGSSTAVITSALTAFCVAKTFLPLTVRFGMEANFLMYASMSMLMSVFVYSIVPETRGKTLDEIYESLKNKSKVKSPITETEENFI